VEPVPGDEAGLGWRTRVKFAVRPDGVAGLRRHRSHEVMEIGDCPIAHPLVDAAAVTGRDWPGTVTVEVAVAPGSGQRAVIVAGGAPAPEIAADTVLSAPAARVTCASGPPAGLEGQPGGVLASTPGRGRHARGRRARRAAPAAGGGGARPVLRRRAVRRGPGRGGRPV